MSKSSVSEYISALKQSEKFGPSVISHRKFPAQKNNSVEMNGLVSPMVAEMMTHTGITKLYSHQAEAIEQISKGHNVLVSTPTASGKSLIYNLPVLDNIIANRHSRALYLFPLKALAQDQLRSINQMIKHLPEYSNSANNPTAVIYDGDTSSYMRRKIRDVLPSILITNPDMLHLSLLAYYEKWGNFFSNLTHIIIDEIHTYRGVFGSHAAWLIKRLKRICAVYNSNPIFILSSATVGNPEELGEKLIGSPVKVIAESGAPRAKRNVILVNPLDSAPYTATILLESAIRRGLRTIVYSQSRKMTELITMWTKHRLEDDLQKRIASYRAGFLPEDRRSIERGLAKGNLLGIISTSALELGIDIGNLDICILVGYPGSIMATWQRAGRVGRGMRESLMVMIGHEDALDQHFMRNPDDLFARDVEPVILNPDNDIIKSQHLVCAAAEIPLSRDEELLSFNNSLALLNSLTEKGLLLQSADGNTWFSARTYPQRDVNLRGSGNSYIIRNSLDKENLGEIDGLRAMKECHQGAIYLHMAKTWHVDRFDMDGHEIVVRPIRPHYFTRVLSNKSIEILETKKSITCGAATIHFGPLRVTEIITEYRKHLVGSHKIIGRVPLELPPLVFETMGLWIEIPEWLRQKIQEEYLHFMGGIHAMEHALIGMFPSLVLCDRNDIGGISHPWYDQLEGAAVFIYDGYSGGIGLTEKAFFNISRLMELTLSAVKECPCESGCPSCVHSPKCGSGNRPIDKEASRQILDDLLHGKGTDIKPFLKKTIEKQPANFESPMKFELPEKYGVFDVETRRSAQEVGGWHRAERMGVSVAVLYDNKTGKFFHYHEEEIEQLLEHLFQLDLVVGFNNKRFDNKVLSAYSNKQLGRLPSLDILELITNQLGYRLSLDRLARHTLGAEKNGNGLLALQWFKQGKMDTLRRYCQRDVEITRDLFLYGLKFNHLLFQNKAGDVVRLPVRFDRAVTTILSSSPIITE